MHVDIQLYCSLGMKVLIQAGTVMLGFVWPEYLVLHRVIEV
jgi:hypothetical protein